MRKPGRTIEANGDVTRPLAAEMAVKPAVASLLRRAGYILLGVLIAHAAAHAAGLPNAEAMVCGWSVRDCAALGTVTVEPTDSVPGVAGARASYDPAARRLYVKANQGDDVTAALLAHELVHVLQVDSGQRYTAASCYGMESEAFGAEAAMWAAAHGGDPAFISPPGWVLINAVDDCQKRFGLGARRVLDSRNGGSTK